jgi:hypothetical protein
VRVPFTLSETDIESTAVLLTDFPSPVVGRLSGGPAELQDGGQPAVLLPFQVQAGGPGQAEDRVA